MIKYNDLKRISAEKQQLSKRIVLPLKCEKQFWSHQITLSLGEMSINPLLSQNNNLRNKELLFRAFSHEDCREKENLPSIYFLFLHPMYVALLLAGMKKDTLEYFRLKWMEF